MQGLSILIVDDHTDSTSALARLLRYEGCEVTEARTVREAFSRAASTRVDVLISEVDLADGEGYELLRRVRALYPRVRGLAVTGHDGDMYVEACREAGYERVFVKPLIFDQIRDAIRAPLRAGVGVFTPRTPPPLLTSFPAFGAVRKEKPAG